ADPFCMHRPAVLLMVSLLAGAGHPRAQDPPSIWAGVYSSAQAVRGKTVYVEHCSRCHGEDLTANRNYPLAGERFMDHWEAGTLADLFRRIRGTMPPAGVATVGPDDQRDALAYLHQQNGLPDGDTELAAA